MNQTVCYRCFCWRSARWDGCCSLWDCACRRRPRRGQSPAWRIAYADLLLHACCCGLLLVKKGGYFELCTNQREFLSPAKSLRRAVSGAVTALSPPLKVPHPERGWQLLMTRYGYYRRGFELIKVTWSHSLPYTVAINLFLVKAWFRLDSQKKEKDGFRYSAGATTCLKQCYLPQASNKTVNSSTMKVSLLVLALVAVASADMYLHNPRYARGIASVRSSSRPRGLIILIKLWRSFFLQGLQQPSWRGPKRQKQRKQVSRQIVRTFCIYTIYIKINLS